MQAFKPLSTPRHSQCRIDRTADATTATTHTAMFPNAAKSTYSANAGRGLFKPLPLALAIALAVSAAAYWPQPAQAQTTSQIEIAAQPLGRALNELARQAGLQLTANPELLEGKTAPSVSGNLSAQQALNQLLAGSGLAGQVSGNAVVIRSAAPSTSSKADVLSEVTVTSDRAWDGTTEGKRSYAGSTSATRLNLSLRDTPQSVSVVTRQQIEDQGLATLQDALLQTPGITVDQSTSTQEYTQIYSRGFAVDNYLLDGIPIPNAVEAVAFDMAAYDRIEVVRGATGLVSGIGSPAAAVNLVLKKPTRTFSGAVALQAGSWQRYRSELDLSGPLTADGRIRGRLVAAHQDDHSFIDRYRGRKDVAYGIVEADLTANTVLSAGFGHQKSRLNNASRGFPAFFSDGSLTDFPRSTNGAADWSNYNRTQNMAFATLEHVFENDWVAKVAINHSSNRYQALQGYAQQDYPDRITGAGSGLWLANWNGKPEQNSIDAYASGPFTLLGRQHDLVVGASVSRLNSKGPSYPSWRLPDYDASIPNFYTWNGNSPRPDFESQQTGNYHDKERQTALYSTLRLRPTDQLSVIVGARLSNWERDTSSTPFDGPQLFDHLEEKNKITPYAGLVFALSEQWSAYASYTSIFQPQSYRDLQGNFLPPLEGENYEIGIKGELLDGALNASAAVFQLNQDNLAEAEPGFIWVPGTGGGSYAYRTVKGAVSKGLDLELSGQLLPGWQMLASYNYSRTRDASGARIQTVQPLSSVKLWTSYDLAGAWRGLTVGGGVNWQSSIYREDVGPNNERFTQKGYAVAALMARYQFTKQLSGAVNLNNLFDKKYYSTAFGGFYGDPRNVMVTVKYQF